MAECRSRWPLAVVLVAAALACPRARAATAPADPCSLLPAATVSGATGVTYEAPHSTVAPRPFANTVQGTDCHYEAQGNGAALLFRIYFDPTAADATSLFARLKMFYGPPIAVTGLGDEAYFDARHAIHVRKGIVRFYLQMNDSPSAEKPITTMANAVAGQL